MNLHLEYCGTNLNFERSIRSLNQYRISSLNNETINKKRLNIIKECKIMKRKLTRYTVMLESISVTLCSNKTSVQSRRHT